MRGNLTIIYGENDDLYLDLIKGFPIVDLDEFTTLFINSDEVRKIYQEKIDAFRLSHFEKMRQLKDKRGRVVITYCDENDLSKIYKLRVLYQKNSNKLDFAYLFNNIICLLKEEKDVRLTAELIKKNMFLFETDFAKHRVKDAFSSGKSVREKTYLNNILIDQIIKSTIDNLVVKDYEKAYFAIRKIDSFLERKKDYVTTLEVKEEYFDYHILTSYDSNQMDRDVDIDFNLKQEKVLSEKEFILKKVKKLNGKRVPISQIAIEYDEYCQKLDGSYTG